MLRDLCIGRIIERSWGQQRSSMIRDLAAAVADELAGSWDSGELAGSWDSRELGGSRGIGELLKMTLMMSNCCRV